MDTLTTILHIIIGITIGGGALITTALTIIHLIIILTSHTIQFIRYILVILHTILHITQAAVIIQADHTQVVRD